MELEIKTTKNGAKTIDLKEMGNGDVINVVKKYADVKRTELDSKFGDGTWVACSAAVEYLGEETVYVNMLNHYMPEGYETAEEMSDRFDACGGIGDTIQVTATKALGKDKKGKDIAVTTFEFEVVGA